MTPEIAPLLSLTACEAVDLLSRKEIQPVELVHAALARIDEVEATINAVVTVCGDRALDRAQNPDFLKNVASEMSLAGLPIVVKDLSNVAGVRSTFGSPIFANHLPTQSDIMVQRLEANGALVIGKSNTSEFGAGANTFNQVFGATRNPWNTNLSAGGSSGGSAAALALGEVWLATGSDLAGSLRTPASFCSVVGLRPSPGRVARGPSELAFGTLAVNGPMGRCVEDVGLMLDSMVGWDPRDPMSLPATLDSYRAEARKRRHPKRVAFSRDLGVTPVNSEVAEICERAAEHFSEMGAVVEEASPDFSGAADAFLVLRSAEFVSALNRHLATHRSLVKDDLVWNIELGLSLSSQQIAEATTYRSHLYARVAKFFETYDLIVTPAVCVPPFEVDTPWPDHLDEHQFDHYVDWLRLASTITMTSCPALSLPAGYTVDGRPVGVQLVGRPRGEADLLSAAAALEDALELSWRVPINPNPASTAAQRAGDAKQPTALAEKT